MATISGRVLFDRARTASASGLQGIASVPVTLRNLATLEETTVMTDANGNYSHEARTGALDKNALHYLATAGINENEASALLVAGMAGPVLQRLPMEFLVESKQLIQLAME